MEMKRAAAARGEEDAAEEEGEEVAPERTAGDGDVGGDARDGGRGGGGGDFGGARGGGRRGNGDGRAWGDGTAWARSRQRLARWRADADAECGDARRAGRARAEGKRRRGGARTGEERSPRWRAGERFVRAREGAVAVAPKKTRESDVDILAFPPRARRGREGVGGERAAAEEARGNEKARARRHARGRARVVSRGSDRPRSRQRTPCSKDRVVLTRKRGRPGILAIPSTNGLRMDSDAESGSDLVKGTLKVHSPSSHGSRKHVHIWANSQRAPHSERRKYATVEPPAWGLCAPYYHESHPRSLVSPPPRSPSRHTLVRSSRPRDTLVRSSHPPKDALGLASRYANITHCTFFLDPLDPLTASRIILKRPRAFQRRQSAKRVAHRRLHHLSKHPFRSPGRPRRRAHRQLPRERAPVFVVVERGHEAARMSKPRSAANASHAPATSFGSPIFVSGTPNDAMPTIQPPMSHCL